MKAKSYMVLLCLVAGMMVGVKGAEPQKVTEKQAPKVLHRVTPEYPAEAKQQGIQGKVILEALINEKGDVVDVKAVIDVKTSTDKEKALADNETAPAPPPDPLLVKAAIDAVKQWKYEPYVDASGAVQPVRFTVTINFKLK